MSSSPPIAILSDDDLEAVLGAILATKSGGLTRAGERLLAGLCARHIVEQFGIAGIAAVRVETVRKVAPDLWRGNGSIGRGGR